MGPAALGYAGGELTAQGGRGMWVQMSYQVSPDQLQMTDKANKPDAHAPTQPSAYDAVTGERIRRHRRRLIPVAITRWFRRRSS
jgi:hypothetical protein